MPPTSRPLPHLFPTRDKAHPHRRRLSAERIPIVPVTGVSDVPLRRGPFRSDSDSSATHLPTCPSSPRSLTSSSQFSSSTLPLGHDRRNTTKPTARPRMARFRHFVCAAAMVMGLLSEHGVGKIGIVGVGARAVPYTSFEQHVGRSSSPWEGQRMREVEGLRVRGVSEKDIAARFSTPHPRTLAYPHPEPVVARAAETEPAPVLSAETKARFEAFWNKALVSIGVAAGQQRVDGEAVEGKVDAEAVVEGSDVAVMERAQEEVETTREGSEARELGEVKAREEMKTWLDNRGVDLRAMNGLEERGEEREGVSMAGAVKSVIATGEGMAEKRGEEGERFESAEEVKGAVGAGVVKSAIASGEAMLEKRSEGDEILERAEDVGKAMNAGVVKSVIASGEVMAEKRSEEEEEEEEEEEMPGLQVQKRRASEAKEAVRKALDEWRQGLERRTADVVVVAAPPLAKRSGNMDAENGGLEVRGQMGRLRAVQV